jgi:Protein of unknown function (DUF3455)
MRSSSDGCVVQRCRTMRTHPQPMETRRSMNTQKTSSKVKVVRALSSGFIATAGVLAVGVGTSSAQRTSAQGPFTFPYPSGFGWLGSNESALNIASSSRLAPPPGNDQYIGALPANGTQDYQCRATATGFAWTFTGPRANLFDNQAWLPSYRKLAGTHFNLQGTPQQGTPNDGPRWRMNDGSQVRGRVVSSAPGRTSNDIPFLLLRAENEGGEGFLGRVTFIQRFTTVGGVAPAAATCTASAVGATAQVPYSTTYYFWAPTPPPLECDEFGNYCPA